MAAVAADAIFGVDLCKCFVENGDHMFWPGHSWSRFDESVKLLMEVAVMIVTPMKKEH